MRLSENEKIIITSIIIFVIIWMLYKLIKQKHLPEGFFQDSYENMKIAAVTKYDKLFTSPLDLYSKTTGHDKDSVVDMIIDKGIKLEEMHTRNEAEKPLSGKNLAESIQVSSVLGDVYRYNVKSKDKARIYYNKMLKRLNKTPQSFIQNTENNPETLVNSVEDFYIKNRFKSGVDFRELRDKIRLSRIIQANFDANKKKFKPAKHDIEKKYFEPKKVRSDPQNVHDSELTSELEKKYFEIKNLNSQQEVSAPDLKSELNALKPSDKKRALNVIDFIIKSDGSVSNLNHEKEIAVLDTIWKRIYSEDNKKNRDSLKTAFFNSLLDCQEKNYSGKDVNVCSSGRVSRVINSLTLLDSNPNVSKPLKTQEILRNEVFSKAHKILENSLESTSSNFKKEYNSGQESQAVLEFEEKVKNKIAETITQDYPDSNPKVLDELIKDAQAGI